MTVENFVTLLGADFYTGVPDSQLKPLCDYLFNEYGIDSRHHIIAANEGNAVALAAGYYLATGKVPVVYLQNSGLGNIVNPVASLMNEKVYGIPCLFIVGWRGEPGVYDEPQHVFQGGITLPMLKTLNIPAFVVDKATTEEQVKVKLEEYKTLFTRGRQAAFVVRKDALEYQSKAAYGNSYLMSREEAIGYILAACGRDTVVSTTGKASREVYELRESRGQGHEHDFLTVGSMGHSSSIALEIALNKKDCRVWCLDGDGAVLMHMGAMALIGANNPSNMVHIVLNNQAHESVGGMPTAVGTLDLPGLARACGYPRVYSAETLEALDRVLKEVKGGNKLTFVEVKCAIEARSDLGLPTTTPAENKTVFMTALMGGA